MRPLCILYLGQKWIGERCFELLRSAQSDILHIRGVVSNISSEVWWQTNSIYHQCFEEKLPFIANNKRNEDSIKGLIRAEKINVIISVQHPWILSGDILSLVNFFSFNLHNAKLPTYKGHNACNHAILNGDLYYTSTIHWMSEDVDTGDIAFEEDFAIDHQETARSLYEKAICAGELVFCKLINHLLQNKEIPRTFRSGSGTFHPRKSIDDLREIKNMDDFVEVNRKARAFYFPPFEPAYYFLGGQKFYVLPGSVSWASGRGQRN